MSVRTILKMGDPSLLQISQPFLEEELNTKELTNLITDLIDTMQVANGIGISAPQIGVFKRIIIIEVSPNKRYPHVEPVPRTILINPEYELLSAEQDEMWEGCLSVPGLRGLVRRHSFIRYRAYSFEGNVIEREAKGIHARVFQHEYHHLEGIVFPRILQDMRDFGFEEEVFNHLQYPPYPAS